MYNSTSEADVSFSIVGFPLGIYPWACVDITGVGVEMNAHWMSQG
jgi:hypothetical protein